MKLMNREVNSRHAIFGIALGDFIRQRGALVVALFLCGAAEAQTAGTLDTSFGFNTGVRTQLTFGGTAHVAEAVAVQPDGKILLAGTCRTGSVNQFCVTRLLPNGSDDSSFVGPNNSSNGRALIPAEAGNSDRLSSMVLQVDGRIVLAGTCNNGIGDEACLARLNTNGTLDGTFANPQAASTAAGKFILSVGAGESFVNAVVLQPDGKLMLAGAVGGFPGTRFFALRINSDGSSDTTFNPNGDASFSTYSVAIGAFNEDSASELVVQPDGKVLLVGMCVVNRSVSFDSFAPCLARLHANGAVDSTFTGTSGSAAGTFVLAEQATTARTVRPRVTLQPNGSFILAKDAVAGFGASWRRFSASGAFGDATFLLGFTEQLTSPRKIALQPDGKAILIGDIYRLVNNVREYGFVVARIGTEGSLDMSFNPAGPATGIARLAMTPTAGFNIARALALQPDGKIVVAGSCNDDAQMCIARVHGGSTAARQCSLDIDGDGTTNPLIDGLIAARVMLGLRGNAALGGITFPIGSARTNWSSIQQFLASQCGMAISP